MLGKAFRRWVGGSEPQSEPVPPPESEVEPVAEVEPTPEPEPTSESEPEPEPTSESEPEPEPTPEPEAVPEEPVNTFNFPDHVLELFPEEARVPVSITPLSDPDRLAAGRLFELWLQIPGGHKWLHYFPTYEQVLQKLGGDPVRMLEIGVYKGGSLKMWSQALPAGSQIVGLDIDESCLQFDNPDAGMHVRIGSQDDPELLRELIEQFGPFDFILDDGSHRTDHMIASFVHLFSAGLKPGGQYLAEDTHSNYWPAYRDSDYSFVDFTQDLTNMMHAHYVDHHDERFFREGNSLRLDDITVPRIAAELDELVFRDSLVLITKRRELHLPVSRHLVD